jgi:serine protease Do
MNRNNRLWNDLVTCLLFAGVYSSIGYSAESLAVEPRLKAIFSGDVPENVEDLRAMQRHVQSLSENVLRATVGVQVGSAQGSGVIISSDGFVLTAAHVIGKSGRVAQVFLSDGRRASATTLGTFRTMDAGLLKIQSPPDNDKSEWPHATLGNSNTTALGQWCLATGHPGGIQNGRQASVRLGRILSINPSNALSTDCTLIGGDSGGPLFDMQGTVIGVHSRIGGPLTANLHIPVNSFQESWDRLARGDNWGHTPGNRPFIGVQGEAKSNVARLTRVFPKSPAEQAGLKVEDIVVSFAGQTIRDFDSLRSYVEDQEPGARVPIEVQRGDQRLTLEVEIGRVRE